MAELKQFGRDSRKIEKIEKIKKAVRDVAGLIEDAIAEGWIPDDLELNLDDSAWTLYRALGKV